MTPYGKTLNGKKYPFENGKKMLWSSPLSLLYPVTIFSSQFTLQDTSLYSSDFNFCNGWTEMFRLLETFCFKGTEFVDRRSGAQGVTE